MGFVSPTKDFQGQPNLLVHKKSFMLCFRSISWGTPIEYDGASIMYKRSWAKNLLGVFSVDILVILLILAQLALPIDSASGSITVTAPSAGENWQRGRSKTITWNSNGNVGSSVDIELYKNDIYESAIVNGTSNDGIHSWNIPADLDAGLNYTIKITSCSDSLIFDFSDSYISIGLDKLDFSGYTWRVRDTQDASQGPGPNYFSSSPENVWLDSEGQLHLMITFRNGNWYCAEVYSEESFGYGIYTFFTKSRVDTIDMNSVLGLFTYLDDTNEIDIEFSRWGWVDGKNTWYVTQPGQTGGNAYGYDMVLLDNYSTHSFNWQSDYIKFRSLYGHYYEPPSQDDVIQEWNYTGPDIPMESTERAHMNLWLMSGLAPSDGQEVEVIIKGFDFNKQPTAYIDSISPNPASSDDLVSFSGHGEDTDGTIQEYKWWTDSGNLSKNASFSTSLSSGEHIIYFSVKDDYGVWSNAVNMTLSVKDVGKDFSINLHQGWNLISIPLDFSDNELTSVLQSIDGHYDAAIAYDSSNIADPWMHHHIRKPPHFNDLHYIDQLSGLWVDITTPGGATFSASDNELSQDHNITLQPGWNLVGYPSRDNQTIPTALNNLALETDLGAIWTYNSSSQKLEELNELDCFEIGKGYWIYANSQCIWEVPH
jgi:hypothetical protein